MGTTSEKLTYLNTTKGKIKDSINLTGANITTEPFRQYSTKLEDAYIDIINNGTDTLYNNFPKVSGEGTSLTLNNTYQAPMRNNLKGNTSQTGTSTTSSIPVNVVSGDNEINVVGKNLFDGIIYKENYVISSTGAESYNSSFNLYKMNLKPNTTYTIQFKSTDTIARSSRYIAYKSNDTFIEMIFDFNYSANESVTKTFTTPNETSYILFHIGKLVENIQVEKSSSASTYEPYQGNTYNIDLPVENLLPNLATPFDTTSNGVTKKGENGTYRVYGTATGAFYGVNNALVNNYTIKGGDYLHLCNNSVVSNIAIVFYTTNSNFSYEPNAINRIIDLSSHIGETITGVGFYTSSSFNGDVTLSPMILQTNKQNSYTPYGTTPIELCKIGNYQDYFYKDSGKWYLHKEIKKLVLNGSEPTWARADGNNDYRDFRIPLSDIALANTDPIGYIDNRFVAKTASYWNENGEHLVQMNDKRLSFRIAVSRLTDSTRESWISWLTNNHITTYYALATPTNTEITDTTLINQLEELYIAKSKENQTNISQINNDLGFIISASALKKG